MPAAGHSNEWQNQGLACRAVVFNQGDDMSNHIACSPLTGRIQMGRVNKQGTAFVGEKKDVTSDVLRAVIEKADYHGGAFDIEAGAEKWTVTVAKAS